MADFENIDDLFSEIQKLVEEVMNEEVGKHVKDTVKDQIQKDIYENPTSPKVYERTGDLKRSVVNSKAETKDNEVSIVIDNDSDKIRSQAPNKHYSVMPSKGYGTDFSEYVAWTVHEGRSGTQPFGKGYWTKRRPFMDNAFRKMLASKSVEKAFIRGLKARGVDSE